MYVVCAEPVRSRTSSTIETVGFMTIDYGGQTFPRQVQIYGIEPEERAQTGDFSEYLVNENGKRMPASFEVSQELKDKAPAFSGADVFRR